jgi:hypothetical protein
VVEVVNNNRIIQPRSLKPRRLNLNLRLNHNRRIQMRSQISQSRKA